MAPIPAKNSNGPLVLVGVAVFILIGVGVTGIVEQRSLQSNGSVSSSAIVGEWRATDSASRIVFRADKTLGMALGMSAVGSSEPAALEPGAYQLGSGGVVSLAMKNGKNFTATFREFTPNQFDLVDLDKGAVTVFVKAP